MEFLEFNGQKTNEQAGTIQGYNSLPGAPPLNRFEIYKLWFRQELFQKKLFIRIGKTVPSMDFNNVSKPIPMQNEKLFIPAVTGLIYTLNQHSFSRRTELMYQAYYQAQVLKALYLEPALTYIPTPGASPQFSSAWTGTLRAIVLF